MTRSAELALAEAPARPGAVAAQARQTSCNVAVIGAGPYGLAAAAHLTAAGIAPRLFGDVMASWRRNMPKGMQLRHAAPIADPDRQFSLDAFARANGVTRTGLLPVEEFVAYGTWFQRQVFPDIDARKVVLVAPAAGGFRLLLDDGSSIDARRVAVAMGLANQDFRPAQFAGLPAHLVSHTCEHAQLEAFRGRRVVVIGRGQSACESAVLLYEAGAEVEIISRGPIHWIGAQTPRSGNSLVWRLHDLLTPRFAVGPFPLSWIVDAPGVMHRVPGDLRDWIGVRSLRPAATAWLQPRAVGVQVNPGRKVVGAQAKGERIALRLDDGSARLVDHVLLATGYRVDIAKFGILTAELLRCVDRVEGHPVLSAGFESSVPGLHFLGASAVRSFGPLMRFVAGTGYAARSLTRKALAGRR